MAKTKSITERPMIIVSLAVSKWGVEYLKEQTQNGFWAKTGQLVIVNPNEASVDECTDHKIVNIKDETAKTGSFLIKSGPWSCNIVLPDGTLSTFWECGNDTKYLYSSLNDCLSVLKLHPDIMDKRPAMIERRAESYFNTKTKEVTKDRKIAESWFKGQNPLFIRSSQYQQIGIWVNGGTNYIDVQYYYSNRLQRESCDSWKKAEIAGFRLYNDGTISHFYKGKVHDSDREFCTTRMNYRTLDVRFRESYRMSTLCLDLRSKELGNSTKLCPETLKILKKAGFPETYWCWGNSKRHFDDTYDLVNFATHIQNKNSTKRGATIAEFLSDKPFDQTSEKVLGFNKGVIIRIPGYLETWECDGKTFNHCPRPYEIRRKATSILLEAKIYERYRIWISNDGKTRSCQENIHDGTLWSQCRWDNLNWPDNLREQYDFTVAETKEERKIQEAAVNQYNKMVKTTYSKIFQIMPIFARMSDFLERHPDLHGATGVRALLDAIYYAPKLTETLIKIGHEDWFYENIRGRVYCANTREDKNFSIFHVLNRFGIQSPNDYKEKAGFSMYKNLGVTKEQFLWLSTYTFGPEFIYLFRNTEIKIPGKTTNYAQFSDIPMKTLLALAKATENLSDQMCYDFTGTRLEHYYQAATRVQRLISAFELTPVDIEKCVNRQLDLMMLEDYLRLRQRCDGHNNFNVADWDKIPANQTDLRFSHDRLTEFYNLLLANAERYYRQEEEKRLIACQEKYDVRYKKLKKLAYTKGDEERIIVVPKKLIELVVEGQTLHHCVGSFTQSVSEGRDTIVFLRHKDTPTVPYATVALLQRGDKWVVDQAHTAHNGPITSQDVAFLKRWGEQNNVDINSITERYGAKCHH